MKKSVSFIPLYLALAYIVFFRKFLEEYIILNYCVILAIILVSMFIHVKFYKDKDNRTRIVVFGAFMLIAIITLFLNF
jgi:heme/copper-type cytochrome/quinol oxidase subunit 4